MSNISPDDALMDVVTRLVVNTARSKSHSERHFNKVSWLRSPVELNIRTRYTVASLERERVVF